MLFPNPGFFPQMSQTDAITGAGYQMLGPPRRPQ
jgi:hypothetical protein